MDYTDTLKDVAGAQAIIEWFGCIPHCHDAHLNEIHLSANGPSRLKVAAFNMTDKVDDKGCYVLEKHAVVVIELCSITTVNLRAFRSPTILRYMEISRTKGELESEFILVWAGVFGEEGAITARDLRLILEPGKTA
jgi:hypothetical protein